MRNACLQVGMTAKLLPGVFIRGDLLSIAQLMAATLSKVPPPKLLFHRAEFRQHSPEARSRQT
jgi:hypothetical protein